MRKNYFLFIRPFAIVIVFSCFLNTNLSGQAGVGGTNTMPDIMNLTPVSPNSASLGKFGEIPVGYYTGIPSINVPLYEINTGGLKLPISLDYHAGGVKVEDISSWVGIGWALNAGGVITRQVRGLPDDGPGGYLLTYDSVNRYLAGTLTNGPLTYVTGISQGLMDSQQDLFFYNFGGTAGKFIFDSSGSVLTMPATRNRIEFGSFLGQDQVFKITDLTGNQFFFTNKETSTYGFSVNNALSTNSYSATSSWYLTQINNVLGTDSITFTYAPFFNNTAALGGQTQYLNNLSSPSQYCPGNHLDISTTSNLVNALRLTGIFFKNGSISFNASAQTRCDITSDRSLNSIVIQNTDSSFYKKYTFYQNYASNTFNGCDTVYRDRTRLYLDSLSFSDHTYTLGAYRFSYINRTLLPSRLSYSQDLWGYYNGQPNTTLVPTTTLTNTIYGSVYTTAGANRSSNIIDAQAGTLDTLFYPTGGKTAFQYEANTVNNLTITQPVAAGTGHFQVNPYSPFTQTILDTTFVLNVDYQGLGGVNVNWTINPGTGCSGAQMIGCPVTTIIDSTGTVAGPIRTAGNAFVHKGTVRVKVDFRTVTDSTIIQNYVLALSWPIPASSVDSLVHNAPVGGLRIRKITNYSAANSIAATKQYTYSMPDSVNYSSGSLLSYPSFIGTVVTQNYEQLPADFPADELYSCGFITISSSPNSTLISDQSSYVTYKFVQELLGPSGNFGKNEYQFTSADQYSDIMSTFFPFPPGMSLDWKRGKLVHEKSFRYNSNSGQYELIKETTHNYSGVVTHEYSALKIGSAVVYTYPINPMLSDFVISQYNSQVGYFLPVSDTQRVYDQNDGTRYEQTVNTYVNSSIHYQPVTVTSANSKGELQVTQNRYPLDYAGLTASDKFTAGIRNLQDKNVVTPVIEKYTQLQNPDGTNSRTLQGVITSYKAGTALPDTVWSTEFSAPSTSFTEASVTGGAISKSGFYLPQVALGKYDAAGNIAEQQKKTDDKRAYIWDYQLTYPVAEVINADSASIAYTSFEADGSGGWSISDTVRNRTVRMTGNNSYNLHGTISKSGLNSATTYVVSYWSTGGSLNVNGASGIARNSVGSWTCYEHEVTGAGSLTIIGTATIDELRLFPKGSLMTTYTYTPLVGLSSQCTPANYITYYGYDTIGRLTLVKDMRGNILKTSDYHYQQR